MTMLQRSPTYIASMPAQDPIANGLRRFLPHSAVYTIVRWKNVLLQSAFYQLSRRRPRAVKKLIRRGVVTLAAGRLRRRQALQADATTPGTSACAWSPTATSSRRSARATPASSPTRSRRFTEGGIKLDSGEELEADVIVTATGLNLLFLGGMRAGASTARTVDVSENMAYKGMMLSGVPNCAFTVGYTNASWTLKADLTSEYVCRLLATWTSHGYRKCVPEVPTRRRRASSRCSTSPPATSCARSSTSPSRARWSRGSCARTTCSTSARSAAARSRTARCGSRGAPPRASRWRRLPSPVREASPRPQHRLPRNACAGSPLPARLDLKSTPPAGRGG